MKAESFSITAIISNNSAMGMEVSGVGGWGGVGGFFVEKGEKYLG